MKQKIIFSFILQYKIKILNNYISKKHYNYILYSLFLLVFIIVLKRPIERFPDSEGYLSMSIIRSPIYPIFLYLLKVIFNNFFEVATIFFQILFNIFSIYYCVRSLKSIIKIDSIWYLLLTVILLFPCVYNLNISNRFLSESISYSLYLLVISNFIVAFLKEKNKFILYSFPLLIVLILTRSQFLFLVPIGILIILWTSLKNNKLKKNSWLLISFICIPIITAITDKTYHSIVHDHFVSTPWTGLHLITPAFFVADNKDSKIFADPLEKEFFTKVFGQLEKDKLNLNTLDLSKIDETSFYIQNYSKIANQTIYAYGKNILNKNLSENEKFIALNKITKKMTPPLILNNWKLWIKLYIKNFLSAFNNAKYALLVFIILIFGFIKLWKKPSNEIKFIFLGSLFLISNVLIIAIGMHTVKRFTFYNDWVIFLIIFILFDTLTKYKSTNDS